MVDRRPGSATNRRLSNRGRLGAVVLLAMPMILIIIGMLLNREFARTRELRDAANQSYEARVQIQRLLSVHQDIEAGKRGYLLTGDREFLKPSGDNAVRRGRADASFP